MSKIKFVALEGIDGCGKSTVITRVKDVLEQNKKKVLIFRQPGSTKAGEAIREVILNNEPCDKTTMMLFVAARIDFIEKEIMPLVNDGKDEEVIVIIDRWALSTLVYNVSQANETDARFYMNILKPLEPNPDITIYLYIDAKTSKERLKGKDQNKYDSLDDTIINKRISTYDTYHLANNQSVKVDASQPLEVVVRQCADIISM